MKRTKFLLLVIFLAGCATANRYDPDAEHAKAVKQGQAIDEARKQRIAATNWPASIKALAVARQVRIGMTEEQALLSWGAPQNKSVMTTQYGRNEVWTYQPLSWIKPKFLHFENGTLVAINEW